VKDIAKPLLETCNGNKYILMAIDHYSKWCEAKVVVDHGGETNARFLEDEIIYKFGMPKYVLIDNGYECVIKFNQLCKNYGIVHKHTTPQWPMCNGMAKKIVKTLKYGLTVLFSILEHT
jgi:hypothetical protein